MAKKLAPLYEVQFEDTAHNSSSGAISARAIQEGAETITITAVGFLTCRDADRTVLSQSGDCYDDEPRYRDHLVIPTKNVRRMRRLH